MLYVLRNIPSCLLWIFTRVISIESFCHEVEEMYRYYTPEFWSLRNIHNGNSKKKKKEENLGKLFLRISVQYVASTDWLYRETPRLILWDEKRAFEGLGWKFQEWIKTVVLLSKNNALFRLCIVLETLVFATYYVEKRYHVLL